MTFDRLQRTTTAALVDEAPYQMRNICGALVPESLAVLDAIAGSTIANVRDRALSRIIFHQGSRQTRRRLWYAVHARYLGHRVQWVIDDLGRAASRGPHHPAALGLLYLHFALRDRLTMAWLTGPVWERWSSGQLRVTQGDALADLGNLLADIDVRWTEGSRKKLATSLLSALRDFGLARGSRYKRLSRPVLHPEVTAHLVRILVERGVSGRLLVEHPAWRLFFRTPDEVAGELATLAQGNVIRFERAGSTVILETMWSAA